MLDLILSTVGQGLQWSVMALGVFLTFRILDIADLSVEGTFPLGAAVAATAITSGLARRRRYRLAHDEAQNSGAPGRHSHDDRTLFGEPPRDGKVQHRASAG